VFDERMLLGSGGAARGGDAESLDAVEREHILRILLECGWKSPDGGTPQTGWA